MKKSMPSVLPVLLATIFSLGLSSCKKDDCASPAGLAGTWKLTNRQCYCVPGPTPNETVTFTATSFTFRANGQTASSGTYALATAPSPCGGNGSGPALQFTFSSGNQSTHIANYRIQGKQLILDYGGPCDAPVDTYVRVK